VRAAAGRGRDLAPGKEAAVSRARPLAGGAVIVILISLAVAVSSWRARLSLAHRAEQERSQERAGVATTRTRKATFEVTVEAVGNLAAIKSEPVMTEITGQAVYVTPNGVPVKKGDVIAELDAPRLEREVQQSRESYEGAVEALEDREHDLGLSLELARIGLANAKEELARSRAKKEEELSDKQREIERAEKQFEKASEELELQTRLSEKGLVPRISVDQKEAEVKSKDFALKRQKKQQELARDQQSSEGLDKEAEVKKQEVEVARQESNQKFEVQQTRAQLKMREEELARAEKRLEKAVIRAPCDGIVVLEEEYYGRGSRRPVQPGDRLWENRKIATIPDLDKMRVVVELPPDQARRVKKKQKALLEVEAMPGQAFPAEVTEIAQTASESSSRYMGVPGAERTFQTFVDVTNRKGVLLRPGMTARVRIIVERIPKAVVVPLECVFERDDDRVVYVRRGKDFRPVRVSLGEENPEEVVVLKGLRGGEELALRDMSELSGAAPPTETGARAARSRR
jgi:RND family efflux transporter MFP subunit